MKKKTLLNRKPPSGPALNAANRYAHIDALRAVAVLLVVVQHTGKASGIKWLESVPGPSGVTLFFAISGFIITYMVLRERERTGGFAVGAFYFKRLAKLAPPFLLAVLFPTVIFAAVIGWSKVDWWAVLSQVFFAYNWAQIWNGGLDPAVMPGSELVWSLAVEEQFYIGFALVWLIVARTVPWRTNLAVLAGILIVSSTAWRFWLVAHGAGDVRIARGTDTRIDTIALGVLIACLYHLWTARSSKILLSLGHPLFLYLSVALFLAGFGTDNEFYSLTVRYTLHGLSAGLFILYGLSPRESVTKNLLYQFSTCRLIALIGLASYSIYLAHWATMVLVAPVAGLLPSYVAAPLLASTGVAVGVALYKLVEVPIDRWRRRRYMQRAQMAKP